MQNNSSKLKNKENKNLYIRLLEFGDRHFNGFSYKEIIEDKELDLNEWEKGVVDAYLKNSSDSANQNIVKQSPIKSDIFVLIEKGHEIFNQKEDSKKYIINYEAYFNYIDYLELVEARKTAEDANNHAIWSIRVAIGTLVISIIFSALSVFYQRKQLNNPIEIKQEQFKQLIK